MQGWDTDIVKGRKPKQDRSNNVTISQCFKDNFKDKKASDENVQSFLEEQSKTLRKLMTAESVISQFMEIVHEHKNDSELMTCAEQAMIKFISEFFTLKAKKEVAMFFPSQENERVLTDLIYDSKKTLDICVFSITNDHIANAIYVSFKRGVKVRIITDDECMKQKGSDILDLAASGIHVRSDNNATAHMHNKFAIIDAKYLVNGSFNWTTQAVNYNQENILIVENKSLVNDYQREFDKLWNQFKSSEVHVTEELPYRFKKLKI